MPTVIELREMYEQMVLARRYEERLQEEYLEGKQPAFDISPGRSRANSTSRRVTRPRARASVSTCATTTR